MRNSKSMKTARKAALVVLSLSTVLLGPISAFAYVVRVSPSTGPPRITANIKRRQSPRSDATKLGYISMEQVSDFYQNFPLQSAVLTCGVKASVADTIAQVKPQIEENKNKNKQQEQMQIEQSLVGFQTAVPTDSVHESLEAESPVPPVMDDTKSDRSIDWEARRNLAYVLYGGIFVGAMSHVEYSYAFPLLFGTEKTVATTVEKVFFDNLVLAPTVWLPPAYFIKAWMYGDDSKVDKKETVVEPRGILAQGLDKYLVDVKDNHLLWKYWAIWFPAQTVSFSVVPDHLRVAFMASISFFWFILFSTVSSQGDSDATDAIN